MASLSVKESSAMNGETRQQIQPADRAKIVHGNVWYIQNRKSWNEPLIQQNLLGNGFTI